MFIIIYVEEGLARNRSWYSIVPMAGWRSFIDQAVEKEIEKIMKEGFEEE